MKQQNYNAIISVNSTPEEAFKKISRIDGWWKKDFKGNTEKLNDTFTVDFGAPAFVDFKTTEAIPDKKLVWSVTDCFLPWFNDKKEWNGTKVTWEISPENNGSKINMTHFGLTPDVECYNACESGWNGHVKSSLVKFINEGKGQPQ